MTLGGESFDQQAVLDTLNRQPLFGNMTTLLAHQLIAAKLNAAAIVDAGGTLPPEVTEAIANADTWILNAGGLTGTGGLPARGNSTTAVAQRAFRDEGETFKDWLDEFNNGEFAGLPACADEPDAGEDGDGEDGEGEEGEGEELEGLSQSQSPQARGPQTLRPQPQTSRPRGRP
jgi:hypothetical protein